MIKVIRIRKIVCNVCKTERVIAKGSPAKIPLGWVIIRIGKGKTTAARSTDTHLCPECAKDPASDFVGSISAIINHIVPPIKPAQKQGGCK